MKIALVVYQFIKEKGGVESYVFNLSRHLIDRGHEVHIFAYRFGQDQNRHLVFHHVPSITFWSPLKYWTFAINAPKIVKKRAYHLTSFMDLHKHYFKIFTVSAADATGIIWRTPTP